MRSLTIFQVFLLFCAFAAAEDLCPVQPAELFHYNDTYNVLSCHHGANSLSAIKFEKSPVLYGSIRCFENRGWIGRTPWNTIPHYNWPEHTATCIEYCASTGDGITIKKHETDEKYSSDKISVECTDKSHGLFVGQKLLRPNRNVCSFGGGWISSYREDFMSPQHFECKKIPVCSFYFKIWGDSTTAHFDNATKTLACDDENEKVAVYINDQWTRIPSLNCDEVDGWKDGETKIAEADLPLYAVCTKFIPCTVAPTDGAVTTFSPYTRFDQGTVTLKCVSLNNSLRLIEFDSQRYTSLTCYDYLGSWHIDDMNSDALASNEVPLNVTCVEYCTSTGATERTVSFNLLVKVSCPFDQLYYGDQHAPGGVWCSMYYGWVDTETDQIITADIETPLQLDCRPKPTTTTTLSTDSVPISTTTAKDSTTEDSAFTESTAQALEKDSTLLIVSCGIVILVIIIIIIVCILMKCYANRNSEGRPKTDREDTSDIPDNVVSSAQSEQ